MDYHLKYLKYKTMYLDLKSINQEGGKRKQKKMKKYNSDKTNKVYYQKINGMDIIPNYTETLSEPWFTLISLGLKTVEGRRNKGRFMEMKIGDIIEWTNYDFKPRRVMTKIKRKTVYETFEEYLETEGLDKCLPGIPSLSHGLSVYFKYFTKQDEKDFGVVAIEIELIK